MKKLHVIFYMLALVLVLPACWGDASKHSGCCSCDSHAQHETVAVAEAKPGIIVANVLDSEHYEDCHIPGSISVPFEKVDAFVNELEQKYADKKDSLEVVVYCSNYMCSASGEAANMLVKKGFTKVYAYEAGMADWFQEGLPVVGNHTKKYLAKKMSAPAVQEQHQYAIISTKELAEKLGVSLQGAADQHDHLLPNTQEIIK